MQTAERCIIDVEHKGFCGNLGEGGGGGEGGVVSTLMSVRGAYSGVNLTEQLSAYDATRAPYRHLTSSAILHFRTVSCTRHT